VTPTPLRLTCHPSTPGDVVRSIEAQAWRVKSEGLMLRFRLVGTLARVCVPPPSARRLVHDLWQHTCFEAFVAREGTTAYYELNLAPSGEWGAFAFERYRQGLPLTDEHLAPHIAVQHTADYLVLEAHVMLGQLLPGHRDAALRLALAAVVEDVDGALSYWALAHPPGHPDFHHAAAFALRLEPPAQPW
jgi:hypothetical protein